MPQAIGVAGGEEDPDVFLLHEPDLRAPERVVIGGVKVLPVARGTVPESREQDDRPAGGQGGLAGPRNSGQPCAAEQEQAGQAREPFLALGSDASLKCALSD